MDRARREGPRMTGMCAAPSLVLTGLTHTGHVRTHNEDAYGLEPDCAFAVLADGMGGALAGEVAAQMAVAWLSDGAQRLPKQPVPRTASASMAPVESRPLHDEAHLQSVESVLQAVVQQTNTAIFDRARRQPGCAGMGTTLVAARWEADTLILGHIGDSRAYRIRAEVSGQPSFRVRLDRLSRDHDTVALSGTGHANRRLTRALGVASEVTLELHRHALTPHDWILLCSDGLTDMVPDDQMKTHLAALWSTEGSAYQRARRVLERLVDAALEAGGRDNITVVLGHWDTSKWD